MHARPRPGAAQGQRRVVGRARPEPRRAGHVGRGVGRLRVGRLGGGFRRRGREEPVPALERERVAAGPRPDTRRQRAHRRDRDLPVGRARRRVPTRRRRGRRSPWHCAGTASPGRSRPPRHPSSSDNELLGVTATSATSAWAAGFSLDSQSRNQTLILHWNGSTWQQASTPAVATFGTRLSGIAAGSPSDVWAVGQFYSAADADQPLILHWNGTAWSSRDAARRRVQDRGTLRCHGDLAVQCLGRRTWPVHRAQRQLPVEDPDHALERQFLEGRGQRQRRRQRRPEQPDRCRRDLRLRRMGGGRLLPGGREANRSTRCSNSGTGPTGPRTSRVSPGVAARASRATAR